MLNDALIKKLFEAASIQRWNDHLRPSVGFTELDKQAQKAVIAYILGKLEERRNPITWPALIEGYIFELLQRVILTDIKPPIFHKLMKTHGKELNEWTMDEIKNRCGIHNESFLKKGHEHFFEPGKHTFEKKVLKAAHYLATKWEFKIIYEMNKHLFGIDETANQINAEIENHYDLDSVKEIVTIRGKLRNFIDLVGQLRYQKRWANTPRVPETSVLGHMLIVAILSYFRIYPKNPCDRRKYNIFFGGLFHDLPEVLTRDIISPVKHSVEGLDKLIKSIEKDQVESTILPLLPWEWHEEIKYFVIDEFKNKIVRDGKAYEVTKEELETIYNDDDYCGLDGTTIKWCDLLSAYYEACLSVEFGVKTDALLKAIDSIEKDLPEFRTIRQDHNPTS